MFMWAVLCLCDIIISLIKVDGGGFTQKKMNACLKNRDKLMDYKCLRNEAYS